MCEESGSERCVISHSPKTQSFTTGPSPVNDRPANWGAGLCGATSLTWRQVQGGLRTSTLAPPGRGQRRWGVGFHFPDKVFLEHSKGQARAFRDGITHSWFLSFRYKKVCFHSPGPNFWPFYRLPASAPPTGSDRLCVFPSLPWREARGRKRAELWAGFPSHGEGRDKTAGERAVCVWKCPCDRARVCLGGWAFSVGSAVTARPVHKLVLGEGSPVPSSCSDVSACPLLREARRVDRWLGQRKRGLSTKRGWADKQDVYAGNKQKHASMRH